MIWHLDKLRKTKRWLNLIEWLRSKTGRKLQALRQKSTKLISMTFTYDCCPLLPGLCSMNMVLEVLLWKRIKNTPRRPTYMLKLGLEWNLLSQFLSKAFGSAHQKCLSPPRSNFSSGDIPSTNTKTHSTKLVTFAGNRLNSQISWISMKSSYFQVWILIIYISDS